MGLFRKKSNGNDDGNKKGGALGYELRDTLFGDMPLEYWQGGGSATKPWPSFVVAHQALQRGKTKQAISMMQGVVGMKNLEPRHYLQAWSVLRMLGVQPSPDIAKAVYGVVIEVGMPEGTDILAAYPDHTARYYNFSGSGIVWERPNDHLDAPIDLVLSMAGMVVLMIGPWEGARPGVPPTGQARLNILTPSGLHFGQGPMEAISQDQMGGGLLKAGTILMMAMMELQKQ